MGLLDFLRPPPQQHAELGTLQYGGGRWRGTIALESGARVPLFIPGSRAGPHPFRSLNELQVAIRVTWDEEHTLGALIRDARLAGLNGSILEPR